MNAYAQQYNNNHIATASREQILLMLYDGAIRFTRQAIMAGEKDDHIEKIGRISKVFAIIAELSNTLDHEIGGDIAADLDGLYQFMMRELTAARKTDDEKNLRIVEGLLVDLRKTWREAIIINKKETKQRKETVHTEEIRRSISVAG